MKYNIKNLILKHWHWLLLTLVAIGFFIGTASFNYLAQKNYFVKWLSPDETANYVLTKLYAQKSQLSFFEKYNILAQDIIHPRSFRSDLGSIKPVSFLGLILIYGKIAGLMGYKVIPYLTPWFAALGIIFYYLFIKEIFGRKNALLSALLLTVFPPFIYYSARSLFHNVLFVVLLIISLYFAMLSVKKSKAMAARGWPEILFAALAGSFLGLAIITRTSELIWLTPLWLIVWLANVKKIGLVKLIIFISFMLFSLLPAMYWNKILYQSYWQGGYAEMNRSIINIAGAGSAMIKTAAVKRNLTQIKNNIFYFGLQPLKSLKMFYYYFVRMFYWLFWPALLGFILFLQKIKKLEKRHYIFLISYFVISLVLLFYYGSWDFHDNPDPKSYTIGNSYARYWLPIYLGAMPLASIFLLKLSNIFKKKVFVYGLRVLMVILIYFISLRFVLFGSEEGLVKSARNLESMRGEYDKVLVLTENRAAIITRYHDKLFFPERKVIVGLFDDDNMNSQYAALAERLPLYYYNFTFPEQDINYLNNRKLAEFGLRIMPVEKITKDFTLYKLLSVIPAQAGIQILNK